MRAEKYNIVQELEKRNVELVGSKRLAMAGQSDFPGGNNSTRSGMNNKHRVQHLAIDNPEFPMLFDGKENIAGEFSSYYHTTNKKQIVVGVCKKYDKLLKGHSNYALYFLYSPEDDSYTVIERKEVESLTENFGFDYNNEYIDKLEVNEVIPKGTRIVASKSYDEYGNLGMGVNARTLFASDPRVQDDAIVISESFAKRMCANNVITRIIPVTENTILLNLYGKNGDYRALPNIGDTIDDGIVCATRKVKESRMLSDMRDIALKNPNRGDTIFHCDKGAMVTDITIYSNNRKLENHKVTHQILQYYNDAIWYWSSVYRICKKILDSGSKHIDREIHRWMRQAINYLDTDAQWTFNDTVVKNLIIAIELRTKEFLNRGRKITGRHGTLLGLM